MLEYEKGVMIAALQDLAHDSGPMKSCASNGIAAMEKGSIGRPDSF